MMLWVAVCNTEAKTLYLQPNNDWKSAGARFSIYAYVGGDNTWYNMTPVSGNADLYQATVDDKYTTLIFCRMNGSESENDWKNRWNQTQNMGVQSDKNLCVINGWDNAGSWSFYDAGGGDQPGGGDTPEPVMPTDYSTAVPSQCTDVMLQAFYWNSKINNGYGDTKWSTLYQQVAEIGQHFDLVWLPPSAQAAGTDRGEVDGIDDGIGYIVDCYSTQSSKFGVETFLQYLISGLHNNGVRVIADIVINHCGNYSNSCDFKQENFGSYGQFSPQPSWITSNDEGKTRYGCSTGSNADDGQNGQWSNYDAARDWDHMNPNVQNMCKAYLQWMKGVMQYDGWRYDYAGGFHVSHINDYNVASKPYFSVMEYWVDNVYTVKTRIDEASKNTLAFDFPERTATFKNGIAKGKYSACKNAGLRGQGYSKYAVTFVDNHDTFQRITTETDILGYNNGGSINNKSVIMQCNAYILSLPGVPCVFYPHWYTYKSDIQAMIHARKMAGIHSESTMTEEGDDSRYKATVQGKYGSVILCLGTAANEAAPAGYTQAVKGTNYAMYYNGNGGQGIETAHSEHMVGEKYIENGQLFIRCGEKIYDTMGRIVK